MNNIEKMLENYNGFDFVEYKCQIETNLKNYYEANDLFFNIGMN